MEVTEFILRGTLAGGEWTSSLGRAKARPYISFASNEATRSVLEWASKPLRYSPEHTNARHPGGV